MKQENVLYGIKVGKSYINKIKMSVDLEYLESEGSSTIKQVIDSIEFSQCSRDSQKWFFNGEKDSYSADVLKQFKSVISTLEETGISFEIIEIKTVTTTERNPVEVSSLIK